jgi:hypothetical protein
MSEGLRTLSMLGTSSNHFSPAKDSMNRTVIAVAVLCSSLLTACASKDNHIIHVAADGYAPADLTLTRSTSG